MKEYQSLNNALEAFFGSGTTVSSRRAVSGGDINSAYLLELSNKERLFMKANRADRIGMFRAEAKGLNAIRQTVTIRVPEVLAFGTEDSSSFLLLEYIEEGRRNKDSSEKLGRDLAKLHRSDTASFVPGGRFGFSGDNYIGSNVQINTPKDRWLDFFIDCRLLPQYEMASSYFYTNERKRFDTFLGKLDRYLPEPAAPSLIHGDLWGGNYMIDKQGEPWLIDPAVYVGHAEADLAMTELFGGFDGAFYEAYKETAGTDPGYRDRRDLYNLYHLLNHLNLFGGSYLYSVKAIIDRYM